MKKITLICFGRLKTEGMSDAVAEFSKRLNRYTRFEAIELKPLPIPEKSKALRDQLPEQEGELVLGLIASSGFRAKMSPQAQLWCCDETGRAMKTTEWASELEKISTHGSGELILHIGGSLGVGHNVLNAAHKRISFGPQTFSHELARLVLTEQIYRALSYSEGHPYHNEG